MPQPLVLCWSGGKDSALALHEIRESGQFEVVSLLTTVVRDGDCISMHGVRRELLHRQAAALRLPLEEVWISPAAPNVEYESQMARVLQQYREGGISTVAFGDIFLEDLRQYREQNLARVGMQALFPLWRQDTAALVRRFLQLGFRSTTCCIDTRKVPTNLVGRELDSPFFAELPPDVDPCGENGEFHSFTWAGPVFDTEIPIRAGQTVLRDSFLYCDLLTN